MNQLLKEDHSLLSLKNQGFLLLSDIGMTQDCGQSSSRHFSKQDSGHQTQAPTILDRETSWENAKNLECNAMEFSDESRES
jgi:hypothetical protein